MFRIQRFKIFVDKQKLSQSSFTGHKVRHDDDDMKENCACGDENWNSN